MEKSRGTNPIPKKPMSNFVNPRITFGKSVKPGSAAMFAAAGDSDNDATVNVTFDASTNTVTIDANTASVDVKKRKATIGFDLTTSNMPANATAQIVGVEFAKPVEPSGKFIASSVFEDQSSFIDGSGKTHTVYGKWNNGQAELKVVDDNNVAATDASQNYAYQVWVKVTQGSSTSYFSSPDPQVINDPPTP